MISEMQDMISEMQDMLSEMQERVSQIMAQMADQGERISNLEARASPFASAVISALSAIPTVDGAFLGIEAESDVTVYVLAKEHGVVPREGLLDIEGRLSAAFGKNVILAVRAHQGRELHALATSTLLFARG